jgi:cold shock CspA family protein
MNNTYQGVILFYLTDKGYGYLRIPGTREEFHFRKENLLQPVQAGDQVSFLLKQQRHGYFADQIKLLNLV